MDPRARRGRNLFKWLYIRSTGSRPDFRLSWMPAESFEPAPVLCPGGDLGTSCEVHVAGYVDPTNTSAPLQLAKSYRYGFDVPINGVVAAAWYRLGLERLDGESAREMAGLLADCTQTDLKTEAKRAACFYRAEFRRHPEDAWIATRWALVLLYGLGTARNQEEGFSVLEEVVYRQPNFAPAVCLAGMCYYLASGVAKRDSEAYQLLRRAAGRGHARAMCEVGRFMAATDVDGDLRTSSAWYMRAARLGNAKGQRSIARCLKRGIGMAKSEFEATQWLSRAAEQGQASAQYQLGVAYMNGNGVEPDREEGNRWLQRAATQGCPRAELLLKQEWLCFL